MDVVALITGVPVNATCLRATVILMMVGATGKSKTRLMVHGRVHHLKILQMQNIVQIEDARKDM